MLKSNALILVLISFVAILAILFGRCYYSLNTPLNVPEEGYFLWVPPGSSLKQAVKELKRHRFFNYSPKTITVYASLTGIDRHIQAGEYKIVQGMSALELLKLLRSGNVTRYGVTLLEGWTIQQSLSAIQRHPKIDVRLLDIENQNLLAGIQRPGKHPEGMFFPDTYFFRAYTTDIELLQRAYDAMQERLVVLWLNKDPSVQLKTAYEALIMASIIEKETALRPEMPKVSGVYHRRLKINMTLQADPTVIYGLGNNFGGILLRTDLDFESPYNTYKAYGLPPTPIALPGFSALYAALHPAKGDELYFVADGNGGHVFSLDYASHQQAVHVLREKQKAE